MSPAFLAPCPLPPRVSPARCVSSRPSPSHTKLSLQRLSPASSPPTASAAAPAHSPAVLAYERFLSAERLAHGAPAAPDAPVFEAADGALVCEWVSPLRTSAPAPSPAADGPSKAHSAMLCIADYEAFLATDQAKGVDPAAPVYCTLDGALVCHYDPDR